MSVTRSAVALALGLLLVGCGGEPAPSSSVPRDAAGAAVAVAYTPQHAERFRVERQGPALVLAVWPPWGDPQVADSAVRYLLTPRGSDGRAAGDLRVVEIPVRRLVTTSTTELAHLEILDAADLLVGHSKLDYVSSRSVRQRIGRGEVAEVGGGSGLQPELLLAADADAVLADFLARSELDRLAQVEAAGVPVVLVPSFLESSPLGRAEWLVVTGLLLGRLDDAVAAFEDVASAYQTLASQVAEHLAREPSPARPTVVTGGPWNDVWHVPGGRSYAARFLADAGAHYLWRDDDSAGALPLDIESVYETALDADAWLYPSSWRSLGEIARADQRLVAFRSFRRARVYANDRRLGATGGNDFWESGVARPDVVLADLVKIFHPELLPDHRLVYHRRLAATDGAERAETIDDAEEAGR